MTLWKCRDADAEASGVGMRAALVEATDEGDELGCVPERVCAAVVVGAVARRVAAQGEDVADAGRSVLGENLVDLGLVVADAGEVRDGIKRGGLLEPDDECRA